MRRSPRIVRLTERSRSAEHRPARSRRRLDRPRLRSFGLSPGSRLQPPPRGDSNGGARDSSSAISRVRTERGSTASASWRRVSRTATSSGSVRRCSASRRARSTRADVTGTRAPHSERTRQVVVSVDGASRRREAADHGEVLRDVGCPVRDDRVFLSGDRNESAELGSDLYALERERHRREACRRTRAPPRREFPRRTTAPTAPRSPRGPRRPRGRSR
jgi:hypothetical protein